MFKFIAGFALGAMLATAAAQNKTTDLGGSGVTITDRGIGQGILQLVCCANVPDPCYPNNKQ